MLAKNVLPDALSSFAIIAANKEYQAGNTNIYVQFSESSTDYQLVGILLTLGGKNGSTIITETMPDGRVRAPVVRMPKHFAMSVNNDSNKLELVPYDYLDTSEYWVDRIVKAGYTEIFITQKNFNQ